MFDCACECDYDGEIAGFFATSHPKAKKPYFCCECQEVIEKGQVHTKETGKWDGEIESYRTCAFCYAARKDFCPCFSFGELWNSVSKVWLGEMSEIGIRHHMYENDDAWLKEHVPELFNRESVKSCK